MKKKSSPLKTSDQLELLHAQVDAWLEKVNAELMAYQDNTLRYNAILDDFSKAIDMHKELLEHQLRLIPS